MKRTLVTSLFCFLMVTSVSAAQPRAITERLTVDQAVSSAINASTDLRNLEDSVEDNNEALDRLREQSRIEGDYARLLNLLVQIMQLETANAQMNNNSTVARERLRISVMNLFAAIIQAENGLTLTDESLGLEQRLLDIARVRFELGHISRLDFDTQVNNHNQRRASRDLNRIAIDNAYISLNQMMGRSLTLRYNLILDVTYEPLGDINLMGAINTAIARDPGMANQQGNVNVAEYRITRHDSDYSADTRESLDRNLSQAERGLYDTRRGIEQRMLTAYNSIRENEVLYNNAVLELEALRMQLPVQTRMHELGRIRRIDLDQLRFRIAQQEETVRSLGVSLAIDIIQFRNPATL